MAEKKIDYKGKMWTEEELKSHRSFARVSGAGELILGLAIGGVIAYYGGIKHVVPSDPAWIVLGPITSALGVGIGGRTLAESKRITKLLRNSKDQSKKS